MDSGPYWTRLYHLTLDLMVVKTKRAANGPLKQGCIGK